MGRIVIIGGGFSGTLLGVHLLRRADAQHPLTVTLIERESRRLARGFAYSTPFDACLLNVPAGRMSAFDDDVEHFVRWATSRDPSITGGTFVPRSQYGDYLSWLLESARQRAAHARFESVAEEAIELDDPESPGTGRVVLSSGRSVAADRIVLAMGNMPPCDPVANAELVASKCYTSNPWAPDALPTIPKRGPILLIGTGLTMLDVALVLRDLGLDRGLHAISRRGLLPQAHRPATKAPPTLPFPESMRVPLSTPAKLLRALRREVQGQSSRGIDWREVVTALRHDTPALWQALDISGKRQFLRHLLPFWETHRHRAAPATSQRIRLLRECGDLKIISGRITGVQPSADGVRVTIKPRGKGTGEILRVAHIINCTGPDTDLARSGGRLLHSAIRTGITRQDELHLGLDSAPDGAVIRADGTVSSRLYAIGPLRKPQLWETTAVPELRVHAAALASQLLSWISSEISLR